MGSIATGSVISFSGPSDKLARLEAQGWLKCDGRAVSRQSYPELYLAIGTTYGGDGSPNFTLPDLRGMFLRGVDDGTGRDPDSASRVMQGTGTVVGGRVGSVQQDQLKNHQHNWNHFFYHISWSGNDIAVQQPNDSWNLQTNPRQATNNDGGGSETRPRNTYVYYLIASGTRQMTALAQMDDGTILGVGTDNLIYTRRDLYGSWVQVAGSGSVIGVVQLRDGTVVGIGTDNQLYARATLTSGWSLVAGSGSVIAITQMSDGRILGVGTDHNLYTRDTLASSWVAHPAPGAVLSMAQLPDGRLVGSGTDYQLYLRANLQSPYTGPVANGGSVTAIAQLRSGLMLGVGTDKALYQRGALDGTWVPAP